MKAKVIKRFRDKETKQVFSPKSKDYSVYEGSEDRVKEIASKGYVEALEEESSFLDGNVNEVKGNITSDLSGEELQDLLQKETEGKDRTGVKTHIEDVLKEKEQPPDEEGE
ncbi:hypothetical protein BN988_01603 [Oceanobacillus picturae]|uniref:Uncharacterized protein n=1 Tax=Oceanobacillus picturae TaxID=171693 RepID=W9ACA5_9BACI|nr:hypothetical protein [Oceanobacillus picturae]CDO03103.1 hypothetical protein BN988_01603 [Oceanobacillus picturae]